MALLCDPKNVFALGNLGGVAVVEGRFDDAVAILRKAVKIDPRHYESHVTLGEALAGQGHDAEAEQEFRAALQISAYDWDAYNQLGSFYVKRQRFAEAEDAYRHSVGIMQNTDGLDGLGDLALQKNDLVEAEKEFRDAAEFDSYDHHALYQLSLIYSKLGRLQDAEKEYQLGMQVDIGTDPLAKEAKAEIDKHKGH
jgi:Flp pilus assembly protein TadD